MLWFALEYSMAPFGFSRGLRLLASVQGLSPAWGLRGGHRRPPRWGPKSLRLYGGCPRLTWGEDKPSSSLAAASAQGLPSRLNLRLNLQPR